MYDEYGQEIVIPVWKRPAMLIGIVVVLAVLALAVGAFLLMRSRGESARLALEAVQRQIDGAVALCPEGDTGCREVAITEAAVAHASVEACKNLEGDVADNCAWGVASESSNEAACEAMVNAERKILCQDSVRVSLALASGDASACQRVNDATKKQNCLDTVDPLTPANCSSRGKSAEECASLAQLAPIIAAGNYAACAPLSEPAASECKDATEGSDPDGDGLPGIEEARYGTSNQNPDSDRDGFGDGDEVRDGYNPNGPGQL